MTIDKSWIRENRMSSKYLEGLKNFMKIAEKHVNSKCKVRCPCKTCVNSYQQVLPTVYAHLHDIGFLETYTMWIYHGEKHVGSSNLSYNSTPRTNTPTSNEMSDVIYDVMAEQNTNEENIDEEGRGIDPWTNSSFDQLVELLRAAFLKSKIPASHYEAKKKLRKIGLGYQSIHTCKNDCALFWKENGSMQNCPICKESRWVDTTTKGKKVPQKVLRYFPLTPRLRRMYSSRFTAKDMSWHNIGRSIDGMMYHPVDGKSWQDFDQRYPEFAKEPRNVRLGLAADGFNPFGNFNSTYSTWPIILTTYNTPPWICMKESSFMLTLLIPGAKSPSKDIDVFVRPLVDELKMLWSEGVQMRDASTNTVFNMRAMLLWTINDFPARVSLSGWSGQGYLACPTCNTDTSSIHVTKKMSYVGHRRFLHMNHKWRQSLLFNGQPERRPHPRRFINTAILKQLACLPDRIPGKHPEHGGATRKRNDETRKKELNWTKHSFFFELVYWSSLELKHNIDFMHVEKNVDESFVNTALMKEKTKDKKRGKRRLEKYGHSATSVAKRESQQEEESQ
ncbi:uncharacterized protein LOC111921298 [Lactuca sativa]|uniref:uncharacterized protein LOC111921298 n=1 Tax=Lactuca sativa TaxID=4236 RepID=UPI0022B07CE7|nr:uncharacterized protein LOC111921298 [Lactuca sativa]